MHGCNVVFTSENVRDCVDDALYDRYKRYEQNAMVDLDPNLRWCPNPQCEGSVRKHANKKVKETTCADCGTKVCFSCGEKAHPGLECGQSPADEEFEQWKKSQNAVNCP